MSTTVALALWPLAAAAGIATWAAGRVVMHITERTHRG